MSSNNPVEQANKAKVMQDIQTFRSELNLKIASEFANMTIKETSEIDYAGEAMYEYIPSMTGRGAKGVLYKDVLAIVDGKLVMLENTGMDSTLESWIVSALGGATVAEAPENTTPQSPSKTPATITFANESVTKGLEDEDFTVAVENSGNGEVTYSSGNTSVATVNSQSGQVTIVGAGTAVITATVEDSETFEYAEKTATYTIAVQAGIASISYETANVGRKVTDGAYTNELSKSGDGVVTYSSSNTAVATVNSETGEVTPIANGTAVITATVENTANYTYAENAASYSLSVWNNTGEMPVEYAKAVIKTVADAREYMGTVVDYHPSGDTAGVYRIFYLDVDGDYDAAGTLFIKRDLIMSGTGALTYNHDDAVKTGYNLGDFKQFNPGYPQNTSSITTVGDTQAAYISTKNATEWNAYNVSGVSEYVIGSPSLEMFVDSYNQWKGNVALDCRYVTAGTTLAQGTANAAGYAVAPGYGKTSITDFGTYGADNSVEAGPTGKTMYIYGSDNHFWLGSPSCIYASSVYNAYRWRRSRELLR